MSGATLKESYRVLDDMLFESFASSESDACVVEEDVSVSQVESSVTLRKKFWWKSFAIACSYMISFGSHYENHLFATIKSDIKRSMHLSNMQFHSLSAIVAIPNTILPFFAGIFIDSFGAEQGCLIASFLIFFGTFVSCLGAHVGAFPLLLVGRFFYGIGGGSIVTIQETILTNWFRGKWLALAIAVQLTISRLSTFVSLSITAPITNATGFYGNALIVSTSFCLLSFLLTIAYVYGMKRYGGRELATERTSEQLASSKSVVWKSIRDLSFLFWLLLYCHAIMNGVWSTFIEIASEYLKRRYSDEEVGWFSKGLNIMIFPVLLTGIFGGLIDKYGHRGHFRTFSSLIAVPFPFKTLY